MKPVLSSARVRDALFRLLRAAFRALPVGESTRDTLRQRFLQRFPSVRPIQPKGIAASGVERRPRVHAAERAIGYVERRDEPLPDPLPAALVAFYLPQFHTIPENDEWWGKGFTEWRNVTRALPQFEGHVQPRLPGDLGFYDLRNPQVMRDQAELAEAYGISAFCFYFYWFGGKTLLEDPLKQWLSDTSIELSFCLCWANESWTRRWDGRDKEILIGQQHSPEDDLAFIEHIAPYLLDPRYLRIEGRPLLLLYRPGLLPDASATAERWRNWCRDHAVGEIELAYVQSFERPDPRTIGFDSAVEFPPNMYEAPELTSQRQFLNAEFEGQIVDWRALPDASRVRSAAYRRYPGVNCGWDNEPRRPGQGRVWAHSTPHDYQKWLTHTIRERVSDDDPSQRLVFINAWNEWAEGAVLEPDARTGYAWLDATRSSLQSQGAAEPETRELLRPCVVIHAWYPDLLEEILDDLSETELRMRLFVTTSPERAEAVLGVLRKRKADAELIVAPNRGRDIAPFLQVAARLLQEGEELVLKLHTKKSPHRADGDSWRRQLLGGLIAPHQADRVIKRFAADSLIGLAAPEGQLLPLADHWGSNERRVYSLSSRLGLPLLDPTRVLFPSGSMFWARLSILNPLLSGQFTLSEFEPEKGQLDGTLAHAIERVFGICVPSCMRTYAIPASFGQAGSPGANLDSANANSPELR